VWHGNNNKADADDRANPLEIADALQLCWSPGESV
jgi:hypothetical protein